MKVLCVCNHGNVRSVALARAIKDISFNTEGHPHEAIAIGAQITTPETMMMLFEWSDRVVWLSDAVPAPRYPEVVDYSIRVGHDRWHNPFHPELQEIMKIIAKEVLT